MHACMCTFLFPQRKCGQFPCNESISSRNRLVFKVTYSANKVKKKINEGFFSYLLRQDARGKNNPQRLLNFSTMTA